jgi:hypothetical protein
MSYATNNSRGLGATTKGGDLTIGHDPSSRNSLDQAVVLLRNGRWWCHPTPLSGMDVRPLS